MVPGTGGKTRPMFVGEVGMADLLATPEVFGRPTLLWVECKAGRGKQSPAQRAFQERVEAFGHSYIVAYSSQDVLDWLKTSRACQRISNTTVSREV